VEDVGVAGIGDNMVGITVIVEGIGGKGDTEREFGSGIKVGSAVVVVEVLVPIEVRELHDERLEREPREIEADIGGDDILSLTLITFGF
jgi:hypothetical protein